VSVALEVAAVSKRYANGVDALAGVSLQVADGETLALIGESGSGKSTLLRLFNRLEEPTRGSVLIRGRASTTYDCHALRRATGYVPQDGGLLPHWPVGRNVELVPALLGWTADKRRARADEVLDRVGLPAAEYRERLPIQLSGGQRQRVALARALAADPDVILLDEPFGALDALTRLDLYREFERLRRELDKTLVLVTHDLGEAFRLADRIGVLRRGELLQVGTPQELVDRPAHDYVRALLAHAGARS